MGVTIQLYVGGIEKYYLSMTYVKNHPNPDPDTIEIRLIPEEASGIDYFDTIAVTKNGVTEWYGFVEESTPEVGEDGLEYKITGRDWKLIPWKKWTERFQESREVGPMDIEGNIETGFFGSVKPDELIKFIVRCPISDHPKDKVRHKIGWGIASDFWACCASSTADCHYPEWVALRYTGLAWRVRGGADSIYEDILHVDGYDATYDDWLEYGTPPYLHTESADDMIAGVDLYNAKEGHFTFEDLTASRNYIYSSKLYIKQWGNGKESFTSVHLYDGTDWHNLGYLIDSPMTWTTVEFDVTTILNTVAKVNAAKIYFNSLYGSSVFGTICICYAYLKIQCGDQAVDINQQKDDYFIVNLGGKYSRVMGILIECRNNPQTYAENYNIQYSSMSDCCNLPTGPSWQDFTPAVNVVNNTARDILHSWNPQDDVQCIKIKLTENGTQPWEISQIYVWRADEDKYRILDD